MRSSVRALSRSPGFTASAVLTLALGIASTTCLFTVLNGALLRPLPYKDSDRLVTVLEPVLAADFRDIKAQNEVFEKMVPFETNEYVFSKDGAATVVGIAAVSPAFFPMLGVTPVFGRGFEQSEYVPNNNNVVLLSHSFWVDNFNADTHILGTSIFLNSKPYTVIGVLPPRFRFKRRWVDPEVDVWQPLGLTPSQLVQRGMPKWTPNGPAPEAYATWMLARLKHGVTLEEAQRNFDSVLARLVSGHPDDNVLLRNRQLYFLKYLQTGLIGSVLWPLMGGAALLLLVSCVNVSGLMLSRVLSRRREVAIRTVLGAHRGQIVGHFLEESLLVSAAGAIFALPLSVGALDVFKVLVPTGYVPRLEQVGLDGRIFLFVFGMVLVSALFCGLFPAINGSRSDPNSDLKGAGNSRSSFRGHLRPNPQKYLLAAQIGASMVLLTAGGLMGRSLWLTIHQRLGFDSHNTVLATLMRVKGAQDVKVWDITRNRALSEELLRSVETLPMVQAATLSGVDFEGVSQIPFAAGARLQTPMENMSTAYWWNVSPGFFKTMRIPLIRGRYFTDDDGSKAQPVVVVNEALARTYFNDNALGKHLTHPDLLLPSRNLDAEIVGVVGDTKMAGLTWPMGPEIYTCIWQNIGGASDLILRSNAPVALTVALRQKIKQTNEDFALASVKPVEQAISKSSIARPRFLTFLLVTFAALALMLTVVGLFGTVSFSVARRTREIGIRVALGAQKKDILKTILFDSTLISVAGIVVGTVAALALTRLIRSWLYGVAPNDPVIFITSGTVLFAICLFASYIPSRRALRVDPAVVLRDE